MNKESIVEKIKKLLTLADSNKNASDSEVQAALLKAQELMAKYDVDVELSEEEVIEYAVEICKHKWDMGFRIPLACALSENFRCKTFVQGKSIAFMGHASDAKIVRNVFETAYTFILKEGNRHYNRAYSMGTTTRGVFNSYATGFITGLKAKLGEQSRALIIVTPPDVNKKFEDMSKDWRQKTGNIRPSQFDREVYAAGFRDGKEMLDKKKVHA